MTEEQFELYLKSIECKIEASAIWNAAIEKAAEVAVSDYHITKEEILKLKIK